jgi:transglutaminase-like putative cysteine protease
MVRRVQLQAGSVDDYLVADAIVETDAPAIRSLARQLRERQADEVEFARAAFEWVRDEVAHTLDAQDPTVTLTATEVLRHRVGLCFAKSHLLAALLRAEGVPAGLCYQRLADGDGHTLHGLVAVHLNGEWHRQDPRGNRRGIDAQFSVDGERLAYLVDPALGEVDYPQVLAATAETVVAALRGATDGLALCAGGLPAQLD